MATIGIEVSSGRSHDKNVAHGEPKDQELRAFESAVTLINEDPGFRIAAGISVYDIWETIIIKVRDGHANDKRRIERII